MAAKDDSSMISPPSSISNGPEPSQLPPYPPPLRSGHVLQPIQPLSVFPGTKWRLNSLFFFKFGLISFLCVSFLSAAFFIFNYCSENIAIFHLLEIIEILECIYFNY